VRRTFVTVLSLFVAGVVALATTPNASAAEQYPVSYNFLSSAVLAGTQVDADPPGANDWKCRPTSRHPRPVVLVHGTAGNKNTNWQTYAPLLANNGYCVFALTYGVTEGTPKGVDQFGGMDAMETSAQQLRTFVDKVRSATGARQVDILGHSQGTLMPNYYVKFLGGAPYVHSYVSLAPLWHGTSLAGSEQLNRAMAVFGPQAPTTPVCAACPQMGTGSPFMEKMRSGGVAVKGIRYTNIMTKYDQLVIPYTSGIEAGMRNIVVQDHCATDYAEHFEIAADPVAAGYVLNALDPAHPRPVPCTTVLPFEGPVA
jgi:triacylglycerol esterase/lipase EstA (alpha/beta hydrolase family)